MTEPAFFRDHQLKLLLFGGKGGVGKTTCAAAAAIHLAQSRPESVYRIVSTDPAHSLNDSFAGSPLPPNLEVVELDAADSAARFLCDHSGKLREIASRGTFLDDEDISRLMDLSLPGLDEIMAFLEIAGWVEAGKFDCIIVDTAPTGHTLRLLAMPDLIRNWLKASDAFLAKHRYMKALFSHRYQPDELDDFLAGLAESVNRLEALLRDPARCRFIPVMIAEELSLSETLTLLAKLEQLHISATDIVVNKLILKDDCPMCRDVHRSQMRTLNGAAEKLSRYTLWGSPLSAGEIRGIESLESFWTAVSELDRSLFITDARKPTLSPSSYPVENSGVVAAAAKKLLIFAGKGGVGKTTLACATAVRLASESTDRKVFLFSTDPAHSLSACFEMPIGPQPVQLTPGLTAMELNAQDEFETLKREFNDELEQFIEEISPHFDLTFDRQAMEKIIDFAPAGLDEVMALTRVMGYLFQGGHERLVLDSAPTGHLLRLLEMPAIVDQWLKTFFGLFLKYRKLFRLPKLTERMVQMSKELKYLRLLLRDAEQCALFAVMIPTEMAFQETSDLLAACRRLEVAAPLLFVNMVTPTNDCPFHSNLRAAESEIRRKIQSSFPELHQTVIYRHNDPRGLTELDALGSALYRSVE